MSGNDSKIVVALDFTSAEQAMVLVSQLEPGRCKLKVGKELFVYEGPQFVEKLIKLGFDVFLDLKFPDSPNTVASACRAAAELGVWMVNVHASGGEKMMMAAKEAVDNASHQPLLIAVTVLTSMGTDDLLGIGVNSEPHEQVMRLASLTKQAELDGVVCSAQEAAMLREHIGEDFCLVTPGVRPKWAATGDQQRIMTPSDALSSGASYLVIGRPITAADEPMVALDKIEQEIVTA